MNLQKNRKKLKDIPEAKGKIYINEDLTPLRAKLFGYIKSLNNVERVNTANGRIHCNLANNSHVILNSPDDLFKIGVEQIDMSRLGLNHYVF